MVNLFFLNYILIRIHILDYVELFHSLEGPSKGKINNVFRSARSQYRRGVENHN